MYTASLIRRSTRVCIVHSIFLVLSAGVTLNSSAQEKATSDEATESKNSALSMFEPREYSDSEGAVLKYRLLKPADFDPNERYPLVIFLHGAGERGDDNGVQLKHGMPEFCKPATREKFPCYVLAPQCPKGQRWADVDWSQDHVALPEKVSPSMRLVLDLVDRMLEDAAIDKNRIYLTGLSMGGYGTWDALYRRPDFFAAALPICGGGDPASAERIKDNPIWCFHGGSDKIVDVEFSRVMLEALKKVGGSPKYTEYEGVGHDSWTATYANPEIYEWLFSKNLAQRKKPQAQP
ncbi:MAG: prolyl oligopeptidase family serine peptidase [Pirellulaceae bacterium]